MTKVYLVAWLAITTRYGACPQQPDDYGFYPSTMPAVACAWHDTTEVRRPFWSREALDQWLKGAPVDSTEWGPGRRVVILAIDSAMVDTSKQTSVEAGGRRYLLDRVGRFTR